MRCAVLAMLVVPLLARAATPGSPAAAAGPGQPPPVGPLSVDVRQPAPSLPPLSPGLERRRLRGSVDTAGVEVRAGDDVVDQAVPGLRLLPLRSGGALGHWIVQGHAQQRSFDVIIDSAADRTMVAPELARRLGLELRPGPPVTDASGETTPSMQATLSSITVASTTFVGLEVLVPERALRPDLFLLGRDALAHVDLVVDGVAGGLAFLPAGTPLARIGPEDEADVVAMDIEPGAGRWQIAAAAPGRGGRLVPFVLDIDTGSPLTSVPAVVGIEGGLPADVGRTATMRGAGGGAVEKRGRFALRPLALGMLTVGSVNALETSADTGLLGTDVLARGRVLFSPSRRAMVVFPATASNGTRFDDKGRVLTVELLPAGDLAVDVRRPLVRFLLRPHDRVTGAWRGGAVDIVIAREGRHLLQTGLDFSDGCALPPPEGSLRRGQRQKEDREGCERNRTWSIRMVPVAPETSCLDVCMKLLGDWPPSPERPRSYLDQQLSR